MPCERNLCPSGLGRVGAQLNFELFGAMGEKLDRPPGIDWSRYSTTALVEAIQQVAEEIKAREGQASAGSASAAVAPEGQGLLEPWSCGYRCKWCASPCTRAEGHTRHSCYEHRHRR